MSDWNIGLRLAAVCHSIGILCGIMSGSVVIAVLNSVGFMVIWLIAHPRPPWWVRDEFFRPFPDADDLKKLGITLKRKDS